MGVQVFVGMDSMRAGFSGLASGSNWSPTKLGVYGDGLARFGARGRNMTYFNLFTFVLFGLTGGLIILECGVALC